MLSIDWNVVWSIINLLLLVFLMKKFLFKPVHDIIEKRQKEADAVISEVIEKNVRADKKLKEYKDKMEQLENDGTQIISEARKSANSEYLRILEDAHEQANTIVEDAKSDAEKEKAKIIRSAQKDISDMVLEAAGKIAGNQTIEASDSDLYDSFLSKAGDGNE